MKYSSQLIVLLIGICVHASLVNCGAFDSIKELITGDHGEPEKQLTPEEEVKRQDEESLYQGGIKQQLAHTAVDAVLGRATDFIEENKVPALMKPAIGLISSGLKKKVHHTINSWDDQEQIAKMEAERGENLEGDENGNGEYNMERREGEGEEFENNNHHHHHHEHNHEGENEQGEEHKEGWFEKIKDKITGNDDDDDQQHDHERGERRKRSPEQEQIMMEQQQQQQPKSKISKLISGAKNFLHLGKSRNQRQPTRPMDPQQVPARRKRDTAQAEAGELSKKKPAASVLDNLTSKAKSVVEDLHPRNIVSQIQNHLGGKKQ